MIFMKILSAKGKFREVYDIIDGEPIMKVSTYLFIFIERNLN